PEAQENEHPVHRVRFAKPFAAGKFEVTLGEFREAAALGPKGEGCSVWTWEGHRRAPDRTFANPGIRQDGRHPVVCVTWERAKAFTEWLSLKTGHTYRLLSEAEWEYAARAGSQDRYFFGEDRDRLCRFGNGADRTAAFSWGNPFCSDGVGAQTAEVGSYGPNGFGLHDTIGNVWEWVEDCWHPTYDGAPDDGKAWIEPECKKRAMRGGSWDNAAKDMRSATRGSEDPDGRDNIGFRVARTIE
ncbi:MAG: formylglycine-generating enzyme family protein, partial [Hyphomicrobiaceae bacterium]